MKPSVRKLLLVHSQHSHLAAYRDHTGALLRRFFHIATEVGRTPSTMRMAEAHARISSYRLRTFEDAIIFVHDVERCLRQLDADALEALAAFALLGLDRHEAATAMGLSISQAGRRYSAALDRLTHELLRAGLMSRRFGEDEDDDGISPDRAAIGPVPPATANALAMVPRKPPARATPPATHAAVTMPRR